MRKIQMILMLAILSSAQLVFAADQSMLSSVSKPCAAIADTCLKAGFVRAENQNKKFWYDCMRPIILGQTVSGVTVDPATVKACRADKIKQLKKELSDLESVNN